MAIQIYQMFLLALSVAQLRAECTVTYIVDEDILQFNAECRSDTAEKVVGERAVCPDATQSKCYGLRLKETQRDNDTA